MTPYVEGLVHMYFISGALIMLLSIRTNEKVLINQKTGKRYNSFLCLFIILIIFIMWFPASVYYTIRGSLE